MGFIENVKGLFRSEQPESVPEQPESIPEQSAVEASFQRHEVKDTMTQPIGEDERRVLSFLGLDADHMPRDEMAQATFYTCQKTLSETVGKLPLKRYQRTENGVIVPPMSQTHRLLSRRPNNYLNNKLGMHRKEMTQANVTLEIGTIPLKVASTMYGHTLSKDGAAMTYKTTDKAPYMGVGFIGQEAIDNDTDKYTACWIYKVMFEEGEDSFTTHNDSITFTNQKASGVAVGKKDNSWRDIEQFATEDEALTWLKGKANITE